MGWPKLARDKTKAVLQVGPYRTDLYQILDGTSATASSTVFTYDTVVRLDSYVGDNWIMRGVGTATAVADTGMRLGLDKEVTMKVTAGDVIATIGGKVNITPVADWEVQ